MRKESTDTKQNEFQGMYMPENKKKMFWEYDFSFH
jgi:hypothetical protein